MALAASLLGAATALGALLLSLVATVALVLVVGRLGEATPGGLASAVASAPGTFSLVAALLLAAVVAAAFFAGGYVAARLNACEERMQAVAVWLWAAAIPPLLGTVVLLSTARNVVTAVGFNAEATLLLVALAAMALLGALLGGETAQRGRLVRATERPRP